MQAYCHTQANMPQFSGHYRQRGNGFVVLAMGIGLVAISLARNFKVSTEKSYKFKQHPS